VVVECSKSIWAVETVMMRVEVAVKKLVGVEVAMEEVLPGVKEKAVRNNLSELDVVKQQQHELTSPR
jgi:hypothetical protein